MKDHMRTRLQLKKQADSTLLKQRAMKFDILLQMRPDIITNGLIYAISTGNWNVKRFRMERAGVTSVCHQIIVM